MKLEALILKIKEKKTPLLRFGIVGTILLVLIMLFFYSFQNQLERIVEQESLTYVNEASERNAAALKEKIEGDLDILESLALVLGDLDEFDKDYWLRVLSHEELISEFHRFGILLPDGKRYSLNYDGLDVSDRDFYKAVMKGKSYISDITTDDIYREPSISYAVPIRKDGHVIAGISVGIYTNKYKSLLGLSVFKNKTTSFVINSKGDLVFLGESWHEHAFSFTSTSNIFNSSAFGPEELKKARDEIGVGKNGKVILQAGSGHWDYLIYNKVGIRDWYLVTVVPDDIIIQRYEEIRNESIFVMLLFVALVVGFVLFILIRQMKYNLQLEESNRELRKLSVAVSQSPVSIVITDTEGKIEYANDAACRSTGYRYEELIGRNPNVLKSGETSEDEYKELWETISGGREWRGTFHNKRKDGSFYWESAIITPVFDTLNQIMSYLAIKEDITEKKFAVDELIKFKTAADQSKYGIAITDLNGDIQYVNKAFADLHRWDRDELIGQNVRVLQGEKQAGIINERIRIILSEGRLHTQETDRIRKDGTSFPALLSADLIFDSFGEPQYIAVSVVDLSEIKEKDAEINKFNIAMAQSTIAFVITDTKADIVYVNPAFEKITGYSLKEILGKNARVLGSGRTGREVYRELWSTIESGRTWKGQWVNKKKNGDLYTERVSITPIFDYRGEIINYLAVKEDITELLAAEENRIAREVAEKANLAKTLFLSNMSHEIRTPLNAIIGFAQILSRDKSMSDKQAQQIDTILKSSEHLLKLINNILDLSKIESGRVTLKNNEFDLQELLHDIKIMFSIQGKDKNIYFDIIQKGELPRNVYSDEGKLRQVLINLIGNAIKFTTAGEVLLKVSSKKLDDGILLLEFKVRDTGPGMTPSEMEFIFDSFQQAQAGINMGGTGLGLSICRIFVNLMGGKITVRSRLNVGAVFKIVIPVREVSGMISQKTERYEKVAGLKEGTGLFRILVADDLENNRKMLVDLLEPMGFEIKEAENGLDAVEAFETWQPHAILMDMKMPEMDGYEAIKKIKGTENGKKTLVIAVTASAFEKDHNEVMETGTDFFLSKPFRHAELYRMLESIEGLEYTWMEEPEGESALIPDSASQELIKQISPQILVDLSQAVSAGDLGKMRENIQRISKVNPGLARYLDNLVREYNYDKLLELMSGEAEPNE